MTNAESCHSKVKATGRGVIKVICRLYTVPDLTALPATKLRHQRSSCDMALGMPHKEPSVEAMLRRVFRNATALKRYMDHHQLTLSPEEAARMDEVLQVLEQLEHRAGPRPTLARRAG